MNRIERLAVASILLLFLFAPAPASAGDLAGRWSGRMEPQNLSAEIALELARAGTSWNAALTFRAGPTDAALPVEELRVADDGISLRTRIEGADVELQLALDDGLLIGSVRVTEAGRVLAEGPAGLAPSGNEAAQQGLMRWLDAQGTAIEPARRGAVIERAAELMLAGYGFPDRAALAAADVRARAERGEYDAITSPARLAELLSRHLAAATSDRHVRVKFGAERVADPLADTTAEETPDELTELRRAAEAEGFGIGATRVLDGNVGYLEMKRFFRADLAGDALAAAMQRLGSTDALIVDLRECRGGDPGMVVLVASWFFDGRPRHWNDMLRRVDGTTTQFWTATWLPGARHANKPLYVLTARRTFSAPESLAYELQQTKRATIVGETTGGGAHSGAWFPIDDRFAIFVPLSRYVSATSGGDWEGVGVQPDVACPAAEALDRAHRAALAQLGRE